MGADAAAQAAQPAKPPSETSRLSALERLRRVAAEAERSTAPLGAVPPPAAAPAPGGSSKDDVLARLRDELARAERKVHANAARAQGKPVPAAENAPPATPPPSANVRRASPARASPARAKSPARSSSPALPEEGPEAPADSQPPEEGPKAFNHPLSAVEKLRKALEDTHSRLDDKKGLHWLASHEPHWPKAKWPELHHYHELKPNARLHWPDKETGALDALRKAVEDAGKHHAHVSGHLNANMNRMSPMWGEAHARFLDRFKEPPQLPTKFMDHPLELELPAGRAALAPKVARPVSVIRPKPQKPEVPRPRSMPRSSARISLSLTSPMRERNGEVKGWTLGLELGASIGPQEGKFIDNEPIGTAAKLEWTKRPPPPPKIPDDVIIDPGHAGLCPEGEDIRARPLPPPALSEIGVEPVAKEESWAKVEHRQLSDAPDEWKEAKRPGPAAAALREPAAAHDNADVLVHSRPRKPQAYPAQEPLKPAVVVEKPVEKAMVPVSKNRRTLDMDGPGGKWMPGVPVPGARQYIGGKMRVPTDLACENLFLSAADALDLLDDCARPPHTLVSLAETAVAPAPADPTSADCAAPDLAKGGPLADAALGGRAMLTCGVKPETEYREVEAAIAVEVKPTSKRRLTYHLQHHTAVEHDVEIKMKRINLTLHEASCIIQAHVRGLEARRLMEALKMRVMVQSARARGEAAGIADKQGTQAPALLHTLALAEAYLGGTHRARFSTAEDTAHRLLAVTGSGETRKRLAQQAAEKRAVLESTREVVTAQKWEQINTPLSQVMLAEYQRHGGGARGEAAAMRLAGADAVKWTNWMVPATAKGQEQEATNAAVAAVQEFVQEEGVKAVGDITKRVAGRVAAETAATGMHDLTDQGLKRAPEAPTNNTIAKFARKQHETPAPKRLLQAPPKAAPTPMEQQRKLESEVQRLKKSPAPTATAPATPQRTLAPQFETPRQPQSRIPESRLPSTPAGAAPAKGKEAPPPERAAAKGKPAPVDKRAEAATKIQAAVRSLRARRQLAILKARVELRGAVARVMSVGRSAQPELMDKTMALGDAYQRAGNFAHAEQCYLHVLENIERDHGKGDPKCMRPAKALARVYQARGDQQAAEDVLRRASETPAPPPAADPISGAWNAIAGAFGAAPAQPVTTGSKVVDSVFPATAEAAKKVGDAVTAPFAAAAEATNQGMKQMGDAVSAAADSIWNMSWMRGQDDVVVRQRATPAK